MLIFVKKEKRKKGHFIYSYCFYQIFRNFKDTKIRDYYSISFHEF